jgi:FkbM family methyltransferase
MERILGQRAGLLPRSLTRFLLKPLGRVQGYSTYGSRSSLLPHSDVLEFFFALARPSDDVKTVLDIGANAGVMTEGFHLCYPKARVLAFEPNKEVFARLRQNLEAREPFASAFRSGQIEIFNFGLYSRNGEMDLHVLSSSDSSSLVPLTEERRSIYPDLYRPVRMEKVALRTLDDFVSEHQLEHIDIIKIDVEGVYVDVLRGGEATLRKTDQVIIEIDWSVKGNQVRDWIDAGAILFDAGLRLRAIVDVIHNKGRGFSIKNALDIRLRRKAPEPMKSYVMNCIFERA